MVDIRLLTQSEKLPLKTNKLGISIWYFPNRTPISQITYSQAVNLPF